MEKSELLLELWAFRPYYIAWIRRISNGCAEDIFQEACLKLLASGAVFIHPEAGTRYFRRILNSLIVDHFRATWRLEYREKVPERTHDPWPDHEGAELVSRVGEAIERLSVDDRSSLTDYFNRPKGRASFARGTMRYRARVVTRKLRVMIGEGE